MSESNDGDSQSRFTALDDLDGAYFMMCGSKTWSDLLKASRPSERDQDHSKEEGRKTREHEAIPAMATLAAAAAGVLAGVEHSSLTDRPSKKPRVDE